jgi:hypothetical protein
MADDAPSGNGWTITAWTCTCHPEINGSDGAVWGMYSSNPSDPYSERNIFGPFYGKVYYPTYAELAAAHDLIPKWVDNVPALIAEVLELRSAR